MQIPKTKAGCPRELNHLPHLSPDGASLTVNLPPGQDPWDARLALGQTNQCRGDPVPGLDHCWGRCLGEEGQDSFRPWRD